MTTLLAFLVALGVLIAVHEWGHFATARWCGVKVLRFSIGFGKVVWSWTSPRTGVEYSLGLLPLGGYVRMLDEREAPVPQEQRQYAFNNQKLWKRTAVVAAGPLANLLLAVLLYAAVQWAGTTQARAVLSEPPPQSLAQTAGLRGGDEVLFVAYAPDSPTTPVLSFEGLHWWVLRAVADGRDLTLSVRRGAATHVLNLETSQLPPGELGAEMMARVGTTSPFSEAKIGPLVVGDVAHGAGLMEGDRVLSLDGRAVTDAATLRQWIRDAGALSSVPSQRWRVEREGSVIEIAVTPRREALGDTFVGRIGAVVGGAVQTVQVRHDPLTALRLGAVRTWEVSVLTLKTLGRMVLGQASWKNISGPVSIADYAGRSAQAGAQAFVVFLALMSVSLGVMNLLPLPVLDGGHLMYYLWEWVSGREPSQAALEWLQKAGVAVLVALMAVALWNDISRLVVEAGWLRAINM